MCDAYQDDCKYDEYGEEAKGQSQNVRDDWEGREQVDNHGSNAFKGFSHKDYQKHIQTCLDETNKTRQEHEEVEDIAHSDYSYSTTCCF